MDYLVEADIQNIQFQKKSHPIIVSLIRNIQSSIILNIFKCKIIVDSNRWLKYKWLFVSPKNFKLRLFLNSLITLQFIDWYNSVPFFLSSQTALCFLHCFFRALPKFWYHKDKKKSILLLVLFLEKLWLFTFS